MQKNDLAQLHASERIANFDVLETLAIFLVTSVHGVWLNGNISASIAMSIPPLAVPVFFMVHGALLLEKEFSFQKHYARMKKIVLQLFAWSTVYLIVSVCFGWTGEAITLRYLYKYYLKGGVLNGTIGGSLWFIYALLSVYFIYPFLHCIKNDKTMTRFACLLLGACFFVKEIDVWGMYIGQKLFGENISIQWVSETVLPFGRYSNCMFFFLIGYILKKGNDNRKCDERNKARYKRMFVSGGLILVGAFLLFIERQIEFGSLVYNWKPLSAQYTRLGTMCMAVGVFDLFSDIHFSSERCGLFRSISIHTIDVYYIHVIIARLMSIFVFKQQFAGVVPNFIRAICVLLISYGMGQIMRRIPLVKKLL